MNLIKLGVFIFCSIFAKGELDIKCNSCEFVVAMAEKFAIKEIEEQIPLSLIAYDIIKECRKLPQGLSEKCEEIVEENIFEFEKFIEDVDTTSELICEGLGFCNERINNFELEFSRFIRDHSKIYENEIHYLERQNIFKDNLNYINDHNTLSEERGFTLEINKFADITDDEFSRLFKSKINDEVEYICPVYKTNIEEELEPDVDWVKAGGVTQVKNQGSCGSCWSFSATGAIEGMNYIETGELLSLSEKQMVDCSIRNSGCNGGLMDLAFRYIMNNGGQCLEDDYPYVPTQGKCKSCNPVVTVGGCYDVEASSPRAMKSAVMKQPISVAIQADTMAFRFYSKGIFDDSNCQTDLDHGVLLTGYGEEENGDKYWVIKNSWGTTWGDEGYIRMKRNDIEGEPGMCGVLLQASYPVPGKAIQDITKEEL